MEIYGHIYHHISYMAFLLGDNSFYQVSAMDESFSGSPEP